jgi:hypothetical protein
VRSAERGSLWIVLVAASTKGVNSWGGNLLIGDYTVPVSRDFNAKMKIPGTGCQFCRRRPRRNSDEEKRMKKIGFLTLLITATLLLALASPVAAAGPKPPAPPVVAAAAAPVPVAAAAVPERHPHIDEALESMRAAKHHLESAEHDFDGHRAKAIEHLNQAMHEAEICMSMK